MNAYWLPASLLVAGLLLSAGFHSAPRYADADWRKRVPEMDSEAFYRQQELNTTLEARLVDFGLGLVGLGISLVVAWALLRIARLEDLGHVQTPDKRWKLLILANVTWLGFLPVQIRWLFLTAKRGDYPWWADSIGIPLMDHVMLTLYGLPVINLGLLACLARSRLPAGLWLPPRGTWPWMSSVGLGALCIVVLEVVREAIMIGDALQIPLLVSVLYLLLCGRAAAASVSQHRT